MDCCVAMGKINLVTLTSDQVYLCQKSGQERKNNIWDPKTAVKGYKREVAWTDDIVSNRLKAIGDKSQLDRKARKIFKSSVD